MKTSHPARERLALIAVRTHGQVAGLISLEEWVRLPPPLPTPINALWQEQVIASTLYRYAYVRVTVVRLYEMRNILDADQGRYSEDVCGGNA